MTVSVKCSIQIKLYRRQPFEFVGSLPVVRVCNVSDVSLLTMEVKNICKGVVVDFLENKGMSSSEVLIGIKSKYTDLTNATEIEGENEPDSEDELHIFSEYIEH